MSLLVEGRGFCLLSRVDSRYICCLCAKARKRLSCRQQCWGLLRHMPGLILLDHHFQVGCQLRNSQLCAISGPGSGKVPPPEPPHLHLDVFLECPLLGRHTVELLEPGINSSLCSPAGGGPVCVMVVEGIDEPLCCCQHLLLLCKLLKNALLSSGTGGWPGELFLQKDHPAWPPSRAMPSSLLGANGKAPS